MEGFQVFNLVIGHIVVIHSALSMLLVRRTKQNGCEGRTATLGLLCSAVVLGVDLNRLTSEVNLHDWLGNHGIHVGAPCRRGDNCSSSRCAQRRDERSTSPSGDRCAAHPDL